MKQVAIAVDQLLNTLFGGYADETISARVYRNRNNSWWWAFWLRTIDTVFFWQEEHCRKSALAELNRKHLPRAYHLS